LVKIILLYVFFIAINFGWGMVATALVTSNVDVTIDNPVDLAYVDGECFLASLPSVNVGDPDCQITQTCPAEGVAYDEAIHHKLCEVGISFPEALEYDAEPQSPDVCDSNDPLCSGSTNLIQRNVTLASGEKRLVSVLIDSENATSINPANTQDQDNPSNSFLGLGDVFASVGEPFSFIGDIVNAGEFAGSLILNTFTGGFVLDVLGTGILGVQFPAEFLTGIKILIGLAVVSWFAYLIIGKQLF
jgi:hypothetical protein